MVPRHPQPGDILRHPNQDRWDKERAEDNARHGSIHQLETNLKRTVEERGGPYDTDPAYTGAYEAALRIELGRRGVATEIAKPEE